MSKPQQQLLVCSICGSAVPNDPKASDLHFEYHKKIVELISGIAGALGVVIEVGGDE